MAPMAPVSRSMGAFLCFFMVFLCFNCNKNLSLRNVVPNSLPPKLCPHSAPIRTQIALSTQKLPFSNVKLFNSRMRKLYVAAEASEASRSVEDVNTYIKEFSPSGWSSAPLRAGLTADGTAGLYLTRDVKKGEEILNFDASSSLCLTTSKIPATLNPLLGGMPAWAQLALFLLHEKRDDDSPWRLFISALNLEPDTPLLWSTKERRTLLQGTQAMETAEQYIRYVQVEWEAVRGKLATNDRLRDVTFEEFLWAFCVVRANSFPPLDSQQNLTIVALAGILEHHRENSAKLKVKSGGIFGFNPNQSPAKISLIADRDFSEGSLLTMDLMPGQSESSVLVNYGAACDRKAIEAVELKLAVQEDDPFFGDKADTLEQEELPLSKNFILDANRDPTMEMQAFMRLCLLKEKDAFILEPIFRDDLWKDHIMFPFSQQNEEEMCNGMISWANGRLRGFPFSLEEDLDLQRSGRLFPGSREEKALSIRIGEQRALTNTLNYFRMRAASFGNIKFYQERRLMSLNLLTEDGRSTYDPFNDNIA
mmetsp:Transcript_19704/g.29428  ORF Transcript_19704/g.29428 Transcript_19704/m.29428 type:complete len:535 (+) Transcript_19704:1877-3481(+)